MLATNETLMEVIDAIKNTNTVQKQKEEIQHEGERVLATIPQDYQETVKKGRRNARGDPRYSCEETTCK